MMTFILWYLIGFILSNILWKLQTNEWCIEKVNVLFNVVFSLLGPLLLAPVIQEIYLRFVKRK